MLSFPCSRGRAGVLPNESDALKLGRAENFAPNQYELGKRAREDAEITGCSPPHVVGYNES
jgi:hypothetical protein